MGRESVQRSDALHALKAHALGFGHRAAIPVGANLGLGVESRAHHRGQLAPPQGGFAALTRGDPCQSLGHIIKRALIPKPDYRLTHCQRLPNGSAAVTSVCQSDNPASQHDALSSVAGSHETFEILNLRWSG